MAGRGIDVRQSDSYLLIRCSLKDAYGQKVTSGAADLRVFAYHTDGTLLQYDFSDETFKSGGVVTPTASMTHRSVGAYATGVWTRLMGSGTTPPVGFSAGGVYLAQVTHADASPPEQEREFQFGQAQGDAVYHADIHFTRDEANTQDEYTVAWFRDGIRLASGITSPQIQVVKRADGTDLVAATAMTQIGSTGSYKYDATGGGRQTVGEAVLVIATASIDGLTRSWARVLGRDSS